MYANYEYNSMRIIIYILDTFIFFLQLTVHNAGLQSINLHHAPFNHGIKHALFIFCIRDFAYVLTRSTYFNYIPTLSILIRTMSAEQR